MRLFLRVAEAGSFSKAAADIGIGQPTVSRRIQDLEARLGAELFQRTTRALSMTEAGERFYERARMILEEFDDAEAEARALDHEPVGMLRISSTGSLGRLVLTPNAKTFLDLYPHIRVDLMIEDKVTDLVEEAVDLAFRLGDLADSSLMAKKVGEARRALWASPDYLAARGAPKTPGDLADHEALLFRHAGAGGPWTLNDGDQTQDVRVEGRFIASAGEVLAQAAVDGMGVVLAPDWVVRADVRAGRLVRVLDGWEASALPIHAVWSGGKLRGKSKLFVEHLADALRHMPLAEAPEA
ncbi:MAG: LysR family transcriptional regulator [Pseudomonadota bacterium]